VRDLASKVERPLTTDGVANFGYATDDAGWRQSARPIVLWSPDSKKVATFQQDERTVGEMYLVETKAASSSTRRAAWSCTSRWHPTTTAPCSAMTSP